MSGTINILGVGILTWITFLPIIGMIAILAIPSGKDEASRAKSLNYFRYITLFVTFIQLVLSLILYSNFNFSLPGINDASTMQFVERFTWIQVTGLPMFDNLKVEYFLGIDGISMPMLLLTALVSTLAVFASWGIKKAAKGYFAMYLLLVTGMMGVFVALDFFLFYVFWEIMLLPMYFLIGIWGGPRKEYAAIKFFLYTLFGSVFMLLVIIALYFAVGSFNMIDMMDPTKFDQESILYGFGTNWRYIAFAALFVGFAIKVPIVPFHTWLPDAHVEAPTAISVILAGVLLKMGTYGMIRIAWPMFPDAVVYFNWWIALIGAVSIVYGALCALAQFSVGKRDLKKMIAYSSVSHMGYVMLGLSALNTEGLIGAIFQMFNHGTITAMLFMIVGVIYDRAHTRSLDDFGGLANKMPVYTAIMTIAFFAAIGLPGLSGFVSEILVFLGAFKTYPMFAIISGSGIVLGAAYMLWSLQKVFFGKLPEKWKGPWDPTGKIYKNDDVNYVELSGLVPLVAVIIYLGLNPNPIIDVMTSSVNHFVELIRISGNFAGM
ncbi:MAG: NADH-quinone oxidoreductase subunit M [Candidatus Kapabacteria bacterium]|jgi:NADH-quinone oxidoreductase subunit M|nr:NADH-quinone oxidoreductase subunit M [Candidatus Kapabacteria bacterium]